MSELIRLLQYVRTYIWLLFLAILLAAFVGLFEAARTALVKPILDGLTLQAKLPNISIVSSLIARANLLLGSIVKSSNRTSYWFTLLGLMLVFTTLRGISQFFSNYLLTYIGQKVIVQIRGQLFEHLLSQSSKFFIEHRTTDLIAHIVSDVEKMQLAVSLYLADLLREGFTLICLLILAFCLSWKLTLASLLIVPFIASLTARFGKRLRRTSHATQEALQDVFAIAQEVISSHQVIQAFCTEKFERERFFEVSEHLRHTNLKTAKALFLPSPIMDLMGVGIGALVILYTQHLVHTEQITVGGVTATLAALFQLYDPVRKLSQTHNSYSQVIAAGARVFKLLDEHTEILDTQSAIALPTFNNQIKFLDLSFTYPQSDTPALHNINLVISKGQIIALVGPSGSGKSTLFKLLLRFYECDKGKITIDDIEINSIAIKSLRTQIALVSQDSVLFNESFNYNISYGCSNVAQQAIQAAATAAQADGFIMAKGGYNTKVGEAGNELSGGQKQRIAIARAILKNAPILLLDEATSALDAESESYVQQALDNLTHERTTLVIAHRLSTIKRADKIVVLDKGTIIEEGTHESLFTKNGLYRKLYDLQFQDESERDEIL